MTSPETPEPNLPSPPHGVRECPFCGQRVRSFRSGGAWGVKCVQKGHFISAYGGTEAEAIAAWNHRASDHRLAELTKERDEADENLDEALVWQDVALDRQRRAEAAEQRIAELESRSTRAEGLLGVLAKAAKRACMDHFGGAMGSFSLGRSMMLLQREALAAATLLSSISGGEGKGFGQTPEQPQCADPQAVQPTGSASAEARLADLTKALGRAHEALCEYACQDGPIAPCLRDPLIDRHGNCRGANGDGQCGKPAADAIEVIEAALAKLKEAAK